MKVEEIINSLNDSHEKFLSIDDVKSTEINFEGIYGISIDLNIVSDKLLENLNNKKNKSVIYIGKFDKGREVRLKEELYPDSKNGIFFRKFGSYFGYIAVDRGKPKPESGKYNNNYKFSEIDNEKIKNLIKEILRVKIFDISTSEERELIDAICPPFNSQYINKNVKYRHDCNRIINQKYQDLNKVKNDRKII